MFGPGKFAEELPRRVGQRRWEGFRPQNRIARGPWLWPHLAPVNGDISTYDVAVLGGGAAGLFCARTAGLRGRRAVVLERNARLGNKILISGGGRCNFTNVGATAANYVTSGSPHFAKSAFARFTPADFLALVERHGIEWNERKLGQLFCVHSSREILRMLESECADASVAIRPDCRVDRVERIPGEGTARWEIATSTGTVRASSLVVATGGLSFPKLGATPFGYELAERHGLALVPRRPGLVPLTWNPSDHAAYAELTGLSIMVGARAGADTPVFRENVLFTHRGVSGPVILQVSNQRGPDEPFHLDLLPDLDVPAWLADRSRGGQTLKQAVRGLWPERFATAWCPRNAPERLLGQWSRKDLETVTGAIRAWKIQPAGDEGYPKAEVTIGGVDTSELSSKTMEARKVPGLYFVGEVVDMTGWLGGYNFQWAWASSHAAGQAC